MRFHPFFKTLSSQAVRYLFREARFKHLSAGQHLYGHNQYNTQVYIILSGNLVLNHEDLGVLATLTLENSVGEESYMRPNIKKKQDAVFAQTESYLLSYESSRWPIIKDQLINARMKNDYMKLEKFLKHNFHQKNLLRIQKTLKPWLMNYH